jgi:hypothetical protein
MWGQWAISAREILKFPLLAGLSLLLVVAANADVEADASNGGTPGSVSSEANGPTTCVDLNADCSTLMVNYYGESVEFALFRRESGNDGMYATGSADDISPDKQAAALPGNEKIKSDNTSQLLGIDFLRGFKDKDIDPAFKAEFSVVEDGAWLGVRGSRIPGLHLPAIESRWHRRTGPQRRKFSNLLGLCTRLSVESGRKCPRQWPVRYLTGGIERYLSVTENQFHQRSTNRCL